MAWVVRKAASQFRGGAALSSRPPRRLVCLTTSPTVSLTGAEPILLDNTVVGYLRRVR